MATNGTVRVELHPAGSTATKRSSMPLSSATLQISGTTPTDPNALATVNSVVPGGLNGSCVMLITPSQTLQTVDLWCAIGKAPDATKEPRQLLSYPNTGAIPTFVVEVGNGDRIQLAATI